MHRFLLILCAALIAETAAVAQDLSRQEIVVTGSRIDQDDYSDYQPAIGLRRKADFLVQEVAVRGDTRDGEQRAEEILAMLRAAIRSADRGAIELATGSYILTRLSLDNVEDVDLLDDRRPDAQRVNILVKAPLDGQSVAEAQAAIRAFIEGVPEVGRAQMDEMGDPTLSIVGPDSYRDAIIAEITSDAKRQAEVIGPDYAVELTGLNMPVQWTRAGPGEVLLFIPYELTLRPR
ncbi:TonB-dependent receptor [Qipengyuania sp. ASV99]|uniref:TonB-dependent receptor n=1 Tax=Qipengyuania sp. ASV99 TaxID=3399681 RepID=UPI003A4C582B